jgi:phosphotransferase system enzyme I (PtsI)
MEGIGVSPGIAIGKAWVIQQKEAALNGTLLKDAAAITADIARFDDAVSRAILEISSFKQNAGLALSGTDIDLLETQIEFLSDPQLRDDVTEAIATLKKNVNDALISVIAANVQLFESMDDEYMRARAADIKDTGTRILKHLNPGATAYPQQFEPGTILIAEDISPSDTITMDTKNIAGFVTQAGSKTSHTAIIAKSKSIPAIVGCGNILTLIKTGDIIILDGIKGLVYINPDKQLLDEYSAQQAAYLKLSAQLKALKNVPAITIDGTVITLLANISGAGDIDAVFDNGGEGIGLLRSEMLFMNRDTFPTEDEQFEFYKAVALRSKGKSVIVRTIDIGGDKQIPYFNLPAEQNPFLGYRAIRICLDNTGLFITQLKAILRAGIFGNLKLMFPMISNIQEIREAKKLVEQAKRELLLSGIPFNATIEIGIMIEVPSAAVTADILAKEVDFFSIGTNDLCQYTLAADRMNEKIAHLYDPYNPAVLRLIKYVIEQAQQHRIHVGLCGEMASEPMAALLLLGMGLTEFSMSAAAIPAIKNIINNNNLQNAKDICGKVMAMDNSQSIKQYLQDLPLNDN